MIMGWWPAVESDSDLFPINARAAMFSRHAVFASREHAYCAVLAANLEPGGWRIDEDPSASGRCVISILDDGADWKGLFCWDNAQRVLVWYSHVWARASKHPEDQRRAYLRVLEAYETQLPLGSLLCSLLDTTDIG
jgi:hypothetical protein